MTSSIVTASTEAAAVKPLSGGMTMLLAAACGLTAANLYYAQPLIGLIAPDIGLGETAASLIVTFTQLGYIIGLVLLVPLGDLLENRALTCVALGCSAVALLGTAWAPTPIAFLAAALCIGVASVAAQMLVPMAAHLSPDATRGRTLGNVMSGLLIGVMLARPISSLIADAFGWRAVFGVAAVTTAALVLVLRALLPVRRPKADHSYFSLIASMAALLRDTPILRRRAAYQALMFGAFSLFWTAAPLELAGSTFGLSQRGIALFALAGAGGALSAPIAGRIADRGWSRAGTGAAFALVVVAFLLARIGGGGSLVALCAAGVVLDAGVQSCQLIGQRAIYGLSPEIRSRLNGLFIAALFTGGAGGSAIASLVYVSGGWERVSSVGLVFPFAALALYATEFRRNRA